MSVNRNTNFSKLVYSRILLPRTKIHYTNNHGGVRTFRQYSRSWKTGPKKTCHLNEIGDLKEEHTVPNSDTLITRTTWTKLWNPVHLSSYVFEFLFQDPKIPYRTTKYPKEIGQPRPSDLLYQQ